MLDDQRGSIFVYFENLTTLENVANRGPGAAMKNVKRDKIGKDVIISFEETQRMLLFCSASKVCVVRSHSQLCSISIQLNLHIFQFDETYKSLQTWGRVVELAPWYPDSSTVSICQANIICRSEEIVLIDSTAQARIYSLVTQQFRQVVVDFVITWELI